MHLQDQAPYRLLDPGSSLTFEQNLSRFLPMKVASHFNKACKSRGSRVFRQIKSPNPL